MNSCYLYIPFTSEFARYPISRDTKVFTIVSKIKRSYHQFFHVQQKSHETCSVVNKFKKSLVESCQKPEIVEWNDLDDLDTSAIQP